MSKPYTVWLHTMSVLSGWSLKMDIVLVTGKVTGFVNFALILVDKL